jgi:hypothetical protein
MADDAQPEIAIDWESAAVDAGRLTVGLTGEPPTGWKKRVEQVVERLERPSNAWGAIKVSKARIRVDEVPPGSEDELHHFLESAVLQANADLRPDADDDASPDDERSEDDERMTDAFRAFAAAHGDEAED